MSNASKTEYQKALREVVEKQTQADQDKLFEAIDAEVTKYVGAIQQDHDLEKSEIQAAHTAKISKRDADLGVSAKQIEKLQDQLRQMDPGTWARKLAGKLVEASEFTSPSYVASSKGLLAFIVLLSVCALAALGGATFVRAQSFLGTLHRLEDVRTEAAELKEVLVTARMRVVDASANLRQVEPGVVGRLDIIVGDLCQGKTPPVLALSKAKAEVETLREEVAQRTPRESEARQKLETQLGSEREKIEQLRSHVDRAERLVSAVEHEQGWTVALTLALGALCVVLSLFAALRLLDAARHERVVRDRAVRASVWFRLVSSPREDDQKAAREIFNTLFDG